MGTKQIIDIVNEARIGTSLPQVTALFGANIRVTRTVEYALSAIRETLEDFRSKPWTAMEALASFTTANNVEAYPVPPDFDYMLTETYWSRANPPNNRGFGPVSKENWRYLKNMGPVSSITPRFRLQGSSLIIFPVPTSAVVQEFDYISRNMVYGTGGIVWGSFTWGAGVWNSTAGSPGWKAEFTANDDTFRLDDAILRKGIHWRLLMLSGKPFAAQREEFFRDLDKQFARDDGGPGRISVGGGYSPRQLEITRIGN